MNKVKDKDPEVARAATPGFSGLGLTDALVTSVAALGYEEATPIQREAIPVLLTGQDIIGQAGTGTGKTAAFALPLLHRLIETPASKKGAVRAMILVPTRELAMQVAEAVHKYSKQTTLTVVPLYGGAPMDQQIRALRRGVDIVVATPGRALDHLRRQTLDLSALEVLVLDEADEMLDMGFAEDLEAILTSTPETRQTALFAATMAPRIASIAERHLRQPQRITIKAEKRAAGKMPLVRQVAYMVSRQQKSFALGRILEFEDPTSAIVFCRTRIEVDELTDTLKSHGYGAQALHGGLDQRQRDRVMQLFRSGKSDVLVATDVAARGLDIDHVSHVINYDIPTAPEVYIHRIGRTGRIGREGVAITLVDPREQRSLRYIETLIKQKIDVATLPTLAALKAKRLDASRAALITRIAAGDLDETRALVQSLSEDFAMVDIAAAALAMFQTESEAPATKAAAEAPPQEPARGYSSSAPARSYGAPKAYARPGAPKGTPYPRPDAREGLPYVRVEASFGAEASVRPPRRDARAEAPPRAPRDRSKELLAGNRVVLAFSVGKDDGVRPADLVGAITGEAGVTSRDLGAIRINDDFSTVEVSEALAEKVLKVMKGKTVRGEKVDVKAMS
ncbi:MAG TPA: DEAD/DEAH box helicase [Vicinamibacterales bacterium]|nr:DEAD/DEAH box helicase [Vicinamibacterales bacterium]